MIGSIISVLLVALIVCLCYQPNLARFFGAFVFVAVTWGHELFFSDLDGLMYYGSAALCDLAIIVLTSGLNPVPEMVVRLQKICLMSIIANSAGWALWMLYWDPILYNMVFVTIYAAAVLAMLKKDTADVLGGDAMARRGSRLRDSHHSRSSHVCQNTGEM